MICTRCDKETYSGTHLNEGLVCTNCLNRERYENGEESFFLCKICGEADSPKLWAGDGVLGYGLCFSCSFWTRHINAYRHGRKLSIGGNLFAVGAEERGFHNDFRGYGGRFFTIKMLNTGKEFITSNLWHNGEIPERFRKSLPDNAIFIK